MLYMSVVPEPGGDRLSFPSGHVPGCMLNLGLGCVWWGAYWCFSLTSTFLPLSPYPFLLNENKINLKKRIMLGYNFMYNYREKRHRRDLGL